MLVPPLLIPPLLVSPLLRSLSCAGTDGATSNASRLLFSGLSSEVSSSPAVVVTKKLVILPGPATALSSRRFFSRFFLQHRRHTSAYVYPTDTLHHNEVEQELQDTFSLQRTQLTTLHRSIQSTLFPNYNGVFKKNQNRKPTATRIGCYVHSPTLVSIVLNWAITARGASWVHDIEEYSSPASARGATRILHYTVLLRQCESFGSLALVCWQAQFNGCASSTSQAYAPMHWRRTNISQLPCTQKKWALYSGAPVTRGPLDFVYPVYPVGTPLNVVNISRRMLSVFSTAVYNTGCQAFNVSTLGQFRNSVISHLFSERL